MRRIFVDGHCVGFTQTAKIVRSPQSDPPVGCTGEDGQCGAWGDLGADVGSGLRHRDVGMTMEYTRVSDKAQTQSRLIGASSRKMLWIERHQWMI